MNIANDDHDDFPTIDLPRGSKMSVSKSCIYITLDSDNAADRERFHRFMVKIGQAHERRVPAGRLEIRLMLKDVISMPKPIEA